MRIFSINSRLPTCTSAVPTVFSRDSCRISADFCRELTDFCRESTAHVRYDAPQVLAMIDSRIAKRDIGGVHDASGGARLANIGASL
jgi:hypothetical protein